MTEEITETSDVERWKPINEYKEKVSAEIASQVNRWSKVRLLDGIDEEYAKGQMAIMLENQRLMNEMITDSGDLAPFKRVSIPMIRRVFAPNSFIAWDVVSVQAMIGPKTFVFFDQTALQRSLVEETKAYTKKLKSQFKIPFPENVREQYSLDVEAQMVADLSASVCNEFNEEILIDLYNNCAIIETADYQGAESVWTAIQGLCLSHKATSGFDPTWIATGDKLADELKHMAEFQPCECESKLFINVSVIGTIGGMKLIACKNMFNNDIVVGYKGQGSFDSTYAFMPYVPFTLTPVILDPETFEPRRGLITRYGKLLCNNGAKFFARVTINGFGPDPVEEKFVGPLDIGENVA